MPTGPKHLRYDDNNVESPCRCTYGEDHGPLQDDGTRYCCGGIYEEGETTCISCGERL